MKLVAPYALLVLGLLEALRYLRSRTGATAGLQRLGACVLSAAGAFVWLLAALDQIAPPYDASAGKLVAAGPLHHLEHMLSFAARQTSPHGPRGIASYPWQWLGDYNPIVYLNVNPGRPTSDLNGIHPAVHFLGMISPPILLLALPALFLAARAIMSDRRGGESSDVPILGLAWFIGTFVPFELLSLFLSRTSYLYYMVIVMPGVYVLVSYLIVSQAGHRRLVGVWICSVLAAAVVMYPFTPLP